MSLPTGEYPDLLKVVKVIPIHKGGSTQEVNNYRRQFLYYLFLIKSLKNQCIKSYIHFWRVTIYYFVTNLDFEKNPTIYALAQITEMIKVSIDNGKFGCGIFIDLKKAFDTVNHETLLTKLEHYGFRDNVLNWFQSYLSNRK